MLSKSTFLGCQSGEATCLPSSSDGLLGLVRISSFDLDCRECQSQVGLYPGIDFNINSLVESLIPWEGERNQHLMCAYCMPSEQ